MTLTPELRRQGERLATRAARIGQVAFVLAFALLLAAIWGGDWRFAATAALLLPPGVGSLLIASRIRKTLAATKEGE